jgi:hypothetical protein
MCEKLTLARLEAAISLANHIDPATAPNNATIPMAFFKRFQ